MQNSEKIANNAMTYCQAQLNKAVLETTKMIGGGAACGVLIAVAADFAIKPGEFTKQEFLKLCEVSYDSMKGSR